MLQTLDGWIARVGPEAYALLALAAFIEYVFPPFPGDTVVLLGGIYAVRGQKPWALVLAIVTLGSVLGSLFDYWVGTRIARRLDAGPGSRLPFGVKHEQIRGLQERMRRSSAWLMLANRFMPAVRGFIFLAAGASRVSLAQVVGLGGLSALLWNVLLLAAGIAVGGNAERLESWFHRYELAAWGILGGALLVLAIRWALRRARS